jgi:hypothetical protein
LGSGSDAESVGSLVSGAVAGSVVSAAAGAAGSVEFESAVLDSEGSGEVSLADVTSLAAFGSSNSGMGNGFSVPCTLGIACKIVPNSGEESRGPQPATGASMRPIAGSQHIG